MENWSIIGLIIIASVVCILLLIYLLYASKKTEHELDALGAELASRLGLNFERFPENQIHSSTSTLVRSTEIVNWRIGGKIKGREVKLESRSHKTRGMGPHSGFASFSAPAPDIIPPGISPDFKTFQHIFYPLGIGLVENN